MSAPHPGKDTLNGGTVTVSFAVRLQAILALVLSMVLLGSVCVYADQAQYIYDDLGRLSQVIDGQGNVATYHYDAVGNLLSITRNTGGVGTPTITGLTPNTGNAGASVTVSITGTSPTGAALATLPQFALDALAQTSAAPGSRFYTWEWELKPLPAASQTSPSPAR